MTRRILLLCALLAACGAPPAETAAVVAGETVLLEVPPATVPSPGGSMTLFYGGEAEPTLTLSAGFLRRSAVGTVTPTSRLSWAPDARSFFVNDSGSAAWSRLRVWTIDVRAQATEVPAISDAAVAELARRNGCARPDEAEYTTRGMGWGEDGGRIYVSAMVRREVNCRFGGVEEIVALIDVRTAKVLAVEEGETAWRRWPTLPRPVTAP